MRCFLQTWTLGIGTTKQTEDVFQKGRCDEISGQMHGQVTPKRRYLAAIRSKVLSTIHKYKEVSYRRIHVSRSEKRLFGRSKQLFLPRFARRSLPCLRGIISTSPTPPYPTFSAQTAVGGFADMDLMTHCANERHWSRIEDHWQCILLPRGLLIRHMSNKDWEWSLGDLEERVVLTWPAAVIEHEALPKMFALSSTCKIEDVKFRACFDIKQWRVMPVEWCSPCGSFVRTRIAEALEQGITGMPAKKEVSALDHAARQAFYNLGYNDLKKVADLLKIPSDKPTLFDLLRMLVMHILKLQEHDDDLNEIMSLRSCKDISTLSDLLSVEVIDEVFDESTKADLEKSDKTVKTTRTAQQDYTGALRAWRSRGAAASKEPKTASGKAATKAAAEAAAREAAKVPPGDMTREQAQTIMPDGYNIFKDKVNHRWQAFHVKTKKHVASKSFLLHGDRPACIYVLYQSWVTAELKGGVSCPHVERFERELREAGML